MLINRGVFFMANLVLALCLTGRAAEPQEVAGEPEIAKAKLVNTMRLLGTAEVRYRDDNNNRFANQEELLTFLRQRNLLGRSPLDLENPAPYQIQIITNGDATRYQITIQPDFKEKSSWCGTAAFSDDRGVIFLGQAIGCGPAGQTSVVPK